MQPKVSIVIPCYNKMDCIGKMIDSIIIQAWDNIELVFVNDGSTDRTLEVIKQYEPKLRSRGYDVVIINQENQGVAVAVQSGLKCITGEYVCQVDADDELTEGYVSAMAGWLSENTDYDWVGCDCYLDTDNEIQYVKTFRRVTTWDYIVEKWLFWEMARWVWVYMIRRDYLLRCEVIDALAIKKSISQEPQFFIPLALGGGRFHYFQEALYIYHLSNSGSNLSCRRTSEKSIKFWNEYYKLAKDTISRMPINPDKKKHLYVVAELGHCISRITDILSPPDVNSKAIEDFIKKTQLYFPQWNIDYAYAVRYSSYFYRAVIMMLTRTVPGKIVSVKGRVIAWGALGRRAKTLLPDLHGTPLDPDELWDVAGDGLKVKYPDTKHLTKNDLVLVIPKDSDDIIAALEDSPCTDYFLYEEIEFLLILALFSGMFAAYPDLYQDGAAGSKNITIDVKVETRKNVQ